MEEQRPACREERRSPGRSQHSFSIHQLTSLPHHLKVRTRLHAFPKPYMACMCYIEVRFQQGHVVIYAVLGISSTNSRCLRYRQHVLAACKIPYIQLNMVLQLSIVYSRSERRPWHGRHAHLGHFRPTQLPPSSHHMLCCASHNLERWPRCGLCGTAILFGHMPALLVVCPSAF